MYSRSQALGVMALADLQERGVNKLRISTAAAALPMGIEDGAFLVYDGWMLHLRSTAEEVVHLLEERPGCHVLRVAKLIARLPL
jgi:hypothetical protein